jgi:hypothetical protein
MASQSANKGKGKGKVKARMPSYHDSVFIDLTTPSSSAEPVQLPSPISEPRPAQLPSFMTSSSGSSSSQPPPSHGTKRKQSKITSFFPNKKGRIETVALAEDKKVADKAEKAAKKKEKEEKKEQDAAIKAANAQERTKRREAKKRWREWHEEHQMPDITFDIPEDDDQVDYLIATECRNEFGLDFNERKCLPYCERENPIKSDYGPMKLYRRREVAKLAWRKEAMLDGVREEEVGRETLLKSGKTLFEERTGKKYNYKGRISEVRLKEDTSDEREPMLREYANDPE